MNVVTFTLPAELGDDVLGHAPLQILDHDLAPTAQTRLGALVTLESGLYGARTILPDGQELTTTFFVDDHEDTLGPQVIELKASSPAAYGSVFDANAAGAAAPAAAAEAELKPQRNVTARVAAWWRSIQRRSDAAPTPEPGVVLIRQVSGNLLVGEQVQVGEAAKFRLGDKSATQEAPGLQTLICDERWQVCAPIAPGHSRRFEVVARHDGSFLPHFLFDDPDLELLFRYAGAGMVSRQVDIVSQHDAKLARRAFENDDERPIASAVGAYVQLRAGQIDDLAWIDEMAIRFPWFPDPLTIGAEYYARRGEHHRAEQLLLGLNERGLPLFSSGLSYALNRLQQYETITRSTPDAHASPALTELLQKLSQIAVRVDFSCPVLTYDMSATAEGARNASSTSPR